MRPKALYIGVGFFLAILSILPAKLPAAPYFDGKVITVVVGFAAGTGYDRMARLLAKHLPKHIPGKPALVIQNMEGAGSMLAANHLYNIAKPDGLTIGIFNRSLVFAQLLKAEGVRFDMTKFCWIGSPSTEPTVLVIRSDHPCKTIYDVIKAKDTVYIGGQGPTTFGTQMGNIDKDFLGLNIKMVRYSNSPEVYLAIERKELDGRGCPYSSLRPYIDRGLVRPILRGLAVEPGIENLPANVNYAKEQKVRTIMSVVSSIDKVGQPYVAPPKTPAELMDVLRVAFSKWAKDREVQEEARKRMTTVDYVNAEESLRVINAILSQPPEIVKELTKFIK